MLYEYITYGECVCVQTGTFLGGIFSQQIDPRMAFTFDCNFHWPLAFEYRVLPFIFRAFVNEAAFMIVCNHIPDLH